MASPPTWFKALDPDELPEGRVTTVSIGTRSLAMTHVDGRYGALDNRCPHQGGRWGEGSIENGLLRCPWHGWDYCPLTGQPPGELEVDDSLASFPVEVRPDGIYVELEEPSPHQRTVSDLMAESLVNWGLRHVFGMVGHSNLGMADALRRHMKHALLERDVAHLILPDEVQNEPVAADVPASDPAGRLTPLEIAPPRASLQQALELLRGARRPVLIVGHGARFAMGPITALAESLHAPVLTTFKAKGQISDHHPLGCGVLGRSGTPIASWFMNEADLLLVLGASFSNHTGIYPGKPTIQVDLDPLALGKFHGVTVPVWGEIAVVVDALRDGVGGGLQVEDQRPQVAERWAIWRQEKRRRAADDRGQGVASAAVFAAMNRQVPADAVISVDVGNNTYSFGRYFECQAQSVLMSGYLGSIGFAFPGAIGAWAAVGRQRPIVSVSGDGGFGQYLAEFTTAVKYGMNITHLLLNNAELGKISKEQRAGEWPVWQTSLHNPGFAAYAELCGGLGRRVTHRDELDGALSEALAHDGPALVEVMADASLI